MTVSPHPGASNRDVSLFRRHPGSLFLDNGSPGRLQKEGIGELKDVGGWSSSQSFSSI